MSATSSKVQTATTPGSVSAALVSTNTIRPCAWPDRTTRMCSMCGKDTSAAKRPHPVTNGRSSRRVTERPTKLISRLLSRFVIPGPAERRSPESVIKAAENRFRARGLRPRPDGQSRRLRVRIISIPHTGRAQRRTNALRGRRKLVDRSPNGDSASLIALTTAAGAPIAPPSPSPFAWVIDAPVQVSR